MTSCYYTIPYLLQSLVKPQTKILNVTSLLFAALGQENNAAAGNQTVAYEGTEARSSQGKVDSGVMTMPVQERDSRHGQVKLVLSIIRIHT